MSTCNHKWLHLGTVFDQDDYTMPGSSARVRYYYDRFFCERCAETIDRNKREYGNSYCTVMPGAMPK